MASQTILWIGLPHGFTPAPDVSRARLSVFVVPRLQPDADGKLATFDFLDWPSRLEPGKVEFEVAFGQTKVKARLVSHPDARLWKALFERDTFVRPHAPSAVSPVYATYPAARLHDRLKAGYQDVCANSPLDRAPEQ